MHGRDLAREVSSKNEAFLRRVPSGPPKPEGCTKQYRWYLYHTYLLATNIQLCVKTYIQTAGFAHLVMIKHQDTHSYRGISVYHYYWPHRCLYLVGRSQGSSCTCHIGENGGLRAALLIESCIAHSSSARSEAVACQAGLTK